MPLFNEFIIKVYFLLKDESIVISTTSYKASQTETFKIVNKSTDNKTLTLDTALVNTHVCYSEALPTAGKFQSYEICAAVGLLTRNLKIIGQEYAQQREDLYGFRIITSDYSMVNSDGVPLYFKGFLRVSNTEFLHPGQFDRGTGDDRKYGILLSNLGDYSQTRPNYVRDSAFNDGYAAAIGIFGSNNIPIVNNVVHHTIEYAICVEGNSNQIRNNLVTLNYWASTFLPQQAPYDLESFGAIDAHLADSVLIENNFIAGAERMGIYYKGDSCEGSQFSSSTMKNTIANNTIVGALVGVGILPDFNFQHLRCIRMNGFIISKSTYFGLYYQGLQNLVVDTSIFIDNQVNVFSIVFDPSVLTHQDGGKTYTVRDSLLVGQSPSFNCTNDIKPNDINTRYADKLVAFGAGANEKGKVGIVWSNFMSGSNMAPYKPWAGILTYNALTGLTSIDSVTFAHFGVTKCSSYRDYAIASNIFNDDGQHPIVTKNIFLHNVDQFSKVFIHRPNIDKINPEDCVDFDCDGLKKNLLTDLDGSFVNGRVGSSVIPQSEFGWGVPARGLGDFRIPKEALAKKDGTMMKPSELYSYPGVVRDEKLCKYVREWQAYDCQELDYKMLMIESMDFDTEIRRLSKNYFLFFIL